MDRGPGRSVGESQSGFVGAGFGSALAVVLMLVALGSVPRGAHAQCYRVTDTIEVGLQAGISWVATRMNRSGHFCGYRDAFGTSTAFVWRGNGIEWIPLPPEATGVARAYGISDEGIICGHALALHPPSGNVGGVGFVIDGASTVLVYPPLDEGGVPEGTMGLVAVNDAGVSVGWWQGADLHQHACVYMDGTLTVISDLVGGTDNAFEDIGASGIAVGWWRAVDGMKSPFTYDTTSGEVVHLPRVDGFTTWGRLISDGGEAIAEWWPDNNGGYRRAALWDAKLGWIKVDPPVGGYRFLPTSVTDEHHVVGSTTTPTDDPVIWSDGITVRIDDLQVGDETMPIGAYASSRDGSFVGPWNDLLIVVRPVGPPSGDLTHDCHVGFGDLLRILSIWGTEDPEADLDASGAVDAGDLVVLFTLWE
ncbi:MAG: hypothetical protein KDA28_06065 [Phycisphaerales bacterium]|nr:hypothetical protein [Phycisphaerales bacterium]